MKKNCPYAEVIVELSTRKTDRVFHYSVPAELENQVAVGSRVLVPFGNRELAGYVVGFGIPESDVKIRSIIRVLDTQILTSEMLELARWMADSYLCSTAEAFGRILSPRLRVKGRGAVKRVYPVHTGAELEKILATMGRKPRQAAVLKASAGCPGLTMFELAAAAGASLKTVETLVARGMLEAVSQEPMPAVPLPEETDCSGPQLTPQQEQVLKPITRLLEERQFGVFLLHGVTGSGKTEVYLHALSTVLKTGRQGVAMVPEIALTPQMIDLFRARFGGKVAVLHSALSDRDRYVQWLRVKNGEAPVVLGTRSAVFAPLPRPGLFVIDEEHETTYKQEDHLRYHAREVAIKRAQLTGAVVLLGSATPSLESRLKAGKGLVYRLLELPHRIDHKPLPKVRVVDMRQEIKNGNRGIFSRALIEAVNLRLDRGEQVLLFLNRRGYATIVVCRECGLVLKCPSCDISLTYHLDNRLRCHYCNHAIPVPGRCPGCSGRYISHFGTGTQKVEEEAKRIFERARILRMDSDTTTRKGSHERILKSFREGEADILIGTQMIAKGLDLPKVTLVGVINADTTLHMPDFRAAERTFQLLTQVAGRSGRGDLPGEVLIQTYSPDHYSIIAAAAHDYEGFYRNEMKVRRALGYPPFSHLALLLFTHEDENEAKKGALLAKEFFAKELLNTGRQIDILGPAPATLNKIKEKHRWQLILKGPKRSSLKDLIREFLDKVETLRPAFKPVITVDINPQGMI
ncbi:MAG TPA: primosomal protein N' [Bacillota bacterium]|nr:primosomal protein N' [Peptococcaceae bacterium MAG4]HPZ43758.1 primosomal protein N' [Bacillota bacterium]HQD76179.1 primosomal protein N' [Bacillota bacterium]HUM58881.1 primosomal protein N' [Bacillota bacterium]